MSGIYMYGSPATDFGYPDPQIIHEVTMDGKGIHCPIAFLPYMYILSYIYAAHMSTTLNRSSALQCFKSYITQLKILFFYHIFIQANSSSYNASDMCGSPATDFGYSDPGLIHQVTMDG